MSNPQQPELARSRKTPAQDPASVVGVLEGQDQPGAGGPSGPIPVDNQPGHHPAHEQDKPDLNAFAEKLGVVEAAPETPAAAPARGRGLVIAMAALTALLGILGVVVTRRRRSSRR
ncbi:MAG TPA: hypothetical protein VL337_14685 [Acidimicrobiales bacterium]|jgi:hypothetical protein|nr:hypothetical protein [Acidimicrobiales bacterium]